MKNILFLFVFSFCALSSFSQNTYFFPSGVTLDPAIPSPQQFLGYPVGDWHTRHDRIVSYFQELARVSPKAHFQIIGYTNERRPQVVLTITSPENYARDIKGLSVCATTVHPWPSSGQTPRLCVGRMKD